MMINNNIVTLILAAGLSTRMGVLKPLLPVGEHPAIVRSINTAKAAGLRDIIVVTGHRHDELESLLHAEARDACMRQVRQGTVLCLAMKARDTEPSPVSRPVSQDVRIAYNDRYNDGMFSSVYTGVSALPAGASGFFLLPADCCAISPSTFVALAEAFTKNGCANITHPRYNGRRGHPPLIPAKYRDQILAYSGDNGLRGFLAPLPSFDVDTDDPGILMDMDTPEDYAALLKYLGLPPNADMAMHT